MLLVQAASVLCFLSMRTRPSSLVKIAAHTAALERECCRRCELAAGKNNDKQLYKQGFRMTAKIVQKERPRQ